MIAYKPGKPLRSNHKHLCNECKEIWACPSRTGWCEPDTKGLITETMCATCALLIEIIDNAQTLLNGRRA